MRDVKATTCYFTRDEKRTIDEIADSTERPASKVVQFAVRVFARIYSEDPKRAMELARPPGD